MSAAPSLSYLWTHLGAMGVAVRHPAALLLLLGLPVLYLLAGEELRRRRLALSLRLTAFALLVLTLAGVALRLRLPNDRLSVIAAVDLSESIDAKGRQWEQRYLDQVAGALAPGDELGVVAFGKNVSVVRAPGSAQPIDLRRAAVTGTATDIGEGLEAALALLAPDTAHRVLLLSDGNETRGHALTKVALARRSDAAIYTAVPPHADGVDVAVEKLVVAPLVAEGSVFPTRVILRNPGAARRAVLSLSFDGRLAGRERITLQPGLNAVEIPYRLTIPGSHRLRAQVSVAGDSVPGNNFREVTVTVGGKSRVLLVTRRAHSPLADALRRKDFSVNRIRPAAMPTSVEGLLPYHCVVFEDVTAAALRGPRLEPLERYVRDFGGGLIVTGGEGTYGDAHFKSTAMARLLPVTLEPHRPPRTGREPLALFILIDRSNSMGYDIRNRLERSETDSKLAYAKRAALAVVAQLKNSDLVGLIAFDSEPFEVAPLRSLERNRTLLETNVPRLQPGGGTDFYDALASARTQLVRSSIDAKHVILLTDGDTNRSAADHYPLIAKLAKADISVTTIRIGDDTVNLKLLHDISRRTGGQFYHVENVARLPELLLKDTNEAMVEAPRPNETFAARMAGVSQLLRGIKAQELPRLAGYAYARAKPGADVSLYVGSRNRNDPLLGAWQYGLGRVVAFTASIADGAATWVEWNGFGKLWSQVVRWAARAGSPWDYALAVHRADGQLTLTVRSFEDLDGGVLMARLLAGSDQPIDVPLVPRAPREFTAQLPSIAPGRYPLTILKRDGNRAVSQRTELVSVPGHDEEPQEEFEAAQPNLPLLRALAARTGGALDAPIRTVVGRRPGTRRFDQRLDWLFIPLAMLLFLVDVGLRRLGSRPVGK